MMMQEEFDDENHRSLNYTKIDRCQDNISIDNDESYRQIFSSDEHYHSEQKFQINLTNRFRLILFVLLFFTSQSNALPIYQSPQRPINYNQPGNVPPYFQQTPPTLPVARVQLTEHLVYPPQSYNVYRRLPNPIQQINPIPSYSNGATIQFSDQQQSSSAIVQSQQFRRERQRRVMIDKIVTIFDEDGNGQLTKDELYSMALRSNMFPKFHHYLKQTSP